MMHGIYNVKLACLGVTSSTASPKEYALHRFASSAVKSQRVPALVLHGSLSPIIITGYTFSWE